MNAISNLIKDSSLLLVTIFALITFSIAMNLILGFVWNWLTILFTIIRGFITPFDFLIDTKAFYNTITWTLHMAKFYWMFKTYWIIKKNIE